MASFFASLIGIIFKQDFSLKMAVVAFYRNNSFSNNFFREMKSYVLRDLIIFDEVIKRSP